jgi:uncharacterized protein (TIGR02453 family)
MQKILDFLSQLAQNNQKGFLDENRETYQEAKNIFKAFLEKLILNVGIFDEDIKLLQPEKCIFRINRDVRFSNDKSPYKTNFGASLQKGGKKTGFAGYYFHIEPNHKSFLAGGLYMPPNQVLVKVRQEIDYNFESFKNIIEDTIFKNYFGNIEGESLKKAPKGYEIDNPAIDFIKMKSFTVWHRFNDKDLLQDNLLQNITQGCKIMKPFLDFLNTSFE